MSKSEPAPVPGMPEWQAKIWTLIFGLALLALAAWMGWEFYPSYGSAGWPTTEGVVRELKVWEKTRRGPMLYQIDIRYEYTVDGRTYTGQTFNSKGNHVEREEIPGIRQRYAVGSKCPVVYSPLLPQMSILVRDVSVSITAWSRLCVAILAFAGAAFLLFISVKKPARQPIARTDNPSARDDDETKIPPMPFDGGQTAFPATTQCLLSP